MKSNSEIIFQLYTKPKNSKTNNDPIALFDYVKLPAGHIQHDYDLLFPTTNRFLRIMPFCVLELVKRYKKDFLFYKFFE